MSQDVQEHNKKVLETLEIGDLIEVPGRFYSHWAVFIGVEEIVHYTDVDRCGTAADSSSSNVFTNSGNTKACVKKEDFWVIAKHSKVKKNNDKDRHMRPFSREKIKERAVSKIGPISYSVLWNNCEHFAAWCRNGIQKSQQADTALACGVTLGAVGVTGGVAYEASTGGKHIRGGIALLRPGPSSSRATNLEDFTAGGPNGIPNQISGGVDLGVLARVGRTLYDVFTGEHYRRSFPGGALSSIVPTSYSAYTHGMDYLSFLQRNGMIQAGGSFLNMGIQTGNCVCGIMNFQK